MAIEMKVTSGGIFWIDTETGERVQAPAKVAAAEYDANNTAELVNGVKPSKIARRGSPEWVAYYFPEYINEDGSVMGGGVINKSGPVTWKTPSHLDSQPWNSRGNEWSGSMTEDPLEGEDLQAYFDSRNFFRNGGQGIDPRLTENLVAENPFADKTAGELYASNEYGRVRIGAAPTSANPFGTNARFTGVDLDGNPVDYENKHYGYVHQTPGGMTYVPGGSRTGIGLGFPAISGGQGAQTIDYYSGLAPGTDLRSVFQDPNLGPANNTPYPSSDGSGTGTMRGTSAMWGDALTSAEGSGGESPNFPMGQAQGPSQTQSSSQTTGTSYSPMTQSQQSLQTTGAQGSSSMLRPTLSASQRSSSGGSPYPQPSAAANSAGSGGGYVTGGHAGSSYSRPIFNPPSQVDSFLANWRPPDISRYMPDTSGYGPGTGGGAGGDGGYGPPAGGVSPPPGGGISLPPPTGGGGGGSGNLPDDGEDGDFGGGGGRGGGTGATGGTGNIPPATRGSQYEDFLDYALRNGATKGNDIDKLIDKYIDAENPKQPDSLEKFLVQYGPLTSKLLGLLSGIPGIGFMAGKIGSWLVDRYWDGTSWQSPVDVPTSELQALIDQYLETPPNSGIDEGDTTGITIGDDGVTDERVAGGGGGGVGNLGPDRERDMFYGGGGTGGGINPAGGSRGGDNPFTSPIGRVLDQVPYDWRQQIVDHYPQYPHESTLDYAYRVAGIYNESGGSAIGRVTSDISDYSGGGGTSYGGGGGGALYDAYGDIGTRIRKPM